MAGSPYASALGRLKPYFPEFLPVGTFETLLAARDVGEITKLLEATPYQTDLVGARASYQGAALVEVAVNRTLARRIRQAFSATPYAGREIVGAYLARWDLQNIGLILSAKAQNRRLTETDEELVSSREIPAGLYAGVLSLDDLRGLLAQPSVEAVAQGLVRFGYGAAILPLLDAYRRSGDIFPILAVLDREYYRNLLAHTVFFQGDGWVVRELIRGEIDVRNALLLLKSRAAEGTTPDAVQARWIDGGNLPAGTVADLLGAPTVPALAERLRARFPHVGEGDAAFTAEQSLAGYESALWGDYAAETLERVRSYPLSLAIIFHYLLRAQLERDDLRQIAFGAVYGLPAARVRRALVSVRL